MRLLVLVCLLCAAAPARADRDLEVALAGVLQQAHDQIDDTWLRRMLSPDERRRFDEDGGAAQFLRLRQALGIAQLVTCTEGLPEPGVRLVSAAGDLLPPDVYRCELSCQRGRYLALLTLAPADPLVRLDPRPGRIERFYLVSPLLDRAPWPRLPAAATLIALWAAALLSVAWGARRIRGWAPGRRRLPGAPDRVLWRAEHETVLVLRLLSVLLFVLAGVPLLWRLGPRPLWGTAAMVLGLVGLLVFALGLLLSSLGGYFHPRGGWALAGALAGALALLGGTMQLMVITNWVDLPALLGPPAPAWQQGRYRLPLRDGPVYVRHGGPLLDLVYLHEDGRSCRGTAPVSCRGFGREVLAPADALVLGALDRYPDQPLGVRDREHPAGNYVLLKHHREYLLLSHLQRGSVRVRPGQAVRAGEVLGRIGNSGDSDEPHLSLELLGALHPLPGRRPPPFCGAAPDPERSTGIPLQLDGYRRHGLLGARVVERGAPSCGQLIAP